MNKDKLKRQYFKKGARALKKLISIDQDCYCCPLCKKMFLPKALEVGILTLEHAPPKEVGGRPLALTCKECNSIAGYSIDAAVVNRERLLDAVKGITGQKRNYKGRATLSMGGEEINVKLEVDEGSISLKPPQKINNPKKLAAYKNYMMHLYEAGKWNGEKFKITPLARYHQKYSKVGDLKTAFIICFAFFGYTFVLNKRLSPIREQIIGYKDEIIDRYWIVSDPKINQKYFICFIEKPISAIAVKIDKSTILLPWLEGPKNLYKHMKENYKDEESFTFEGKFFNWPETLEMKLDFFEGT